MPTTTYDLRQTNATLVSTPELGTGTAFSEYTAIGWKADSAGAYSPYPTNFRSRRATIIFRVRGSSATIKMPSSTGATVSIDGGASAAISASNTAVLFTGLPDDFHTVKLNTQETSSIAADGTVSVTGADPAMDYATNLSRFWGWNNVYHRPFFALEQERGVNSDAATFSSFPLVNTNASFFPNITGIGKIRFSVTITDPAGGHVRLATLTTTTYRTKIDDTIMAGFVTLTHVAQGGGSYDPMFSDITGTLAQGTHDIELLLGSGTWCGVTVIGGDLVQEVPTLRPRVIMLNDSLGTLSANVLNNAVQEPLLTWERELGFLVPVWIDGRSEFGKSLIQSDNSTFKNPDINSATYRIGIIAANATDNPDAIFCARGANDFGRPISGVTMTRAQWRDGWTDIFYSLRDKASVQKIMMSHIPGIFASGFRATYYGTAELQTFQEVITEITDGNVSKSRAALPAMGAKGYIAPTTTWYTTIAQASDGIHHVSGPTGNLLIAQNLAPYFYDALGLNPATTDHDDNIEEEMAYTPSYATPSDTVDETDGAFDAIRVPTECSVYVLPEGKTLASEAIAIHCTAGRWHGVRGIRIVDRGLGAIRVVLGREPS